MRGSGVGWNQPATPNESGHPPSATPVLELRGIRNAFLQRRQLHQAAAVHILRVSTDCHPGRHRFIPAFEVNDTNR
jgi:hypothetical protein